MWGIDVSRHQGNIDWRSVHEYGVQFAILKAMKESTHQRDERFEYNYDQSSKFGMQVGVYCYVTATNAESAHKEAFDLLHILHGRRLARGIWLDMEDDKIAGLAEQRLTEIIKIESEIFSSGGYETGIYSNLDWYKNKLDGAFLSKSYDWWLARYPKEDKGEINLLLLPDKFVTMWQYTSKGYIQGIKGPVDMDFDMFDLGKDYETIAEEVLMNRWGSGAQRKHRLQAAGYNYDTVRQLVNEILYKRQFYPAYKGLSFKIDAVLKDIGVEPDYIGNKEVRKPLAEANGIKAYTGTLVQNLKLVSLAKKGELKRP